mmetsp:Transcript_4235/g.8153  ORF Transcript_4235/g.8153 Transcript_4235/m.8153 type:complete len:319 (+) Transcript_4235:191-1147(+)
MTWKISAPLVAIVVYLAPSYFTFFAKFFLATLAAYLPFYFDGAALYGRRYNASVGVSPVCKWIWVKGLGLPLSECRWNPDDFKDKDARFIFGSHPHGVGSVHHVGPMMAPACCEPGKGFGDLSPLTTRRDLAASAIFRIPLFRELALLAGAVDADRKVARRMLTEGKSLGILVGGEREQLLSRRGEHCAFVSERKGFLKLALSFGVPVVPCYCFGETDLYDQSTVLMGLRLKLVKAFGVAITIARGRSWIFPWLPYRVKLIHCVGKPVWLKGLELAPIAEPTKEQIDSLHGLYIKGLLELFDAQKEAAGYPNATLTIA